MRHLEAIPLRNSPVKSIAQELVHVFSWTGLPREILTDQETPFMNKVMRELCKALQITQLKTFHKPLPDSLRLNFCMTNILDLGKETWEAKVMPHQSFIEHVAQMQKRIIKVMPIVKEHLHAYEAQARVYNRSARVIEHEVLTESQVWVNLKPYRIPEDQRELISNCIHPYHAHPTKTKKEQTDQKESQSPKISSKPNFQDTLFILGWYQGTLPAGAPPALLYLLPPSYLLTRSPLTRQHKESRIPLHSPAICGHKLPATILRQEAQKYSVIEAATQQLATSIFSQEALVEKQNQTHKNRNSAIQHGSILSKGVEKEKITPLQNVINLSSNLSMLPDGHLNSSTFLGVAEAYLVPDSISKLGISMDSLSCISDEVGTVESLFDNIITEDDIFSSPYGLVQPKTHHLHKKTRKEHEYKTTIQTDLIFHDTNRPTWLPESFDKSGHQLPFLQIASNSMENQSSDFSLSDQLNYHEVLLHDGATLENIEKGSPKMILSEKGFKQIQTGNECGQDVFPNNSGYSVVGFNKRMQDTLHDDIFIDNELEMQSGNINENENIDYNVFWASAKFWDTSLND
ncbi:uncharacterized protein [Phyllobates terribilis]|uniref:uncharacterized protein n=1 Tax=Phyllobates terribilis TaxID=111132 RepID=UPI003CCB28E0